METVAVHGLGGGDGGVGVGEHKRNGEGGGDTKRDKVIHRYLSSLKKKINQSHFCQ